MKYCPYCKRLVNPIHRKKFHLLGCILLGTITCGIGAVLYILYYLLSNGSCHCPICNANM